MNFPDDRIAMTVLAASAAATKDVARLKGAAHILDAARNSYPDDTGKWTVAAVY